MRRINSPLTVFLVGATGDLAKKKIWIALYDLFKQSLLPKTFNLVGVARAKYSTAEFADFLAKILKVQESDPVWQRFILTVKYVSGDVTDPKTFSHLKAVHAKISPCGNHLWYLATLPNLYVSVIKNIKAEKLQATQCGWTKLLLEKPFGVDLATSQQLNRELLQVFEEDQIYRIDHFLAKETVQNLLVFRFGNGLFENLWNHKFVDHIQVTSAEQIGIAGRGRFYDSVGVVRDVLQNHVLQMLAMTLMEEPASLDPADIRKRRMEFLSQLEIVPPEQIGARVAFGQYQAGEVDGQKVIGYTKEDGIPDTSITETAVAGKLFVNNDCWRGVPIYFRLGKRLAQSVTEISIKFKEPMNKMFSAFETPQKANVLTLRIQPNEGVILRLNVKQPGLELQTGQVSMQFCYNNQFQMDLVEAYQKLLYDAIQGDTTLFPQAEDIDASWRFVQPILDYLADAKTRPLPYEAGSWGPAAFEELMAEDGRRWLEPRPDVCVI